MAPSFAIAIVVPPCPADGGPQITAKPELGAVIEAGELPPTPVAPSVTVFTEVETPVKLAPLIAGKSPNI